MTNTNDTIDAITEAVTRRQIKHEPIPLLLVEGYCFLLDELLKMDGSLSNLLLSTVPERSTYRTSKSIVERFDPDLDPITKDMGGPRYLFTKTEASS